MNIDIYIYIHIRIYFSTINHREIGVMFTNLANELGHHLVGEWEIFLNIWILIDINEC